MTKHLVVIDGYGFLFRAYHSMPPLNRADGTPVGAIYGFTSMLMKIIAEFSCSHIAVVLDSGVKTFRNDIYEKYKSNRPPAPEDLIPQFPLVRDAVEALNLVVLEKIGFEADDLIATYVKRGVDAGYKVTIISSDKDLMQLVKDGSVAMYDAMKSRHINEEQIIEKFGVGPSQLLDLLSMMGDSADSIPGIPGIGPKIAAELLGKYGTLDEIYENTEEIKQPKRKAAIQNNKELALLARKLITLDSNVENIITLDDLAVKGHDDEKLLKFLVQQNFKSLITRVKNRLANLSSKNIVSKSIPALEIVNLHELDKFIDEASNEGILAVYPCYNNKTKELLYLSLAYEKTNAILRFTKQQTQGDLLSNTSEGIRITEASVILSKVFESEDVMIISHNIKRLAHILKLKCLNAFEDVELMSYIVENGMVSHDLETLVEYHLDDILKEGEEGGALIEICKILKQKLYNEKLVSLYEKIEKPLITVLHSIENNGIKIDISILNDLSDKFQKEILHLEKLIYNEAEEEFNIASPKQLGQILFEKMGISLDSKKKPSTNVEVLEDLDAKGYSIAGYVLKWRHYSKLKNTYADSLVKLIDKNSRLHTTFLMTQTSTGRLSSIDPNLQNIPIRTQEGKLIRSAFIANDGNKLISADYSQIELRLLAYIAEVTPLINAFKNGIDIHTATASEMFSVPIANVDSELRRKAKVINFGIIYGISAFGLANRLSIPRDVAKLYIDTYFQRYPQILEYMENTKQFAKKNGYVETLFGRKCFLKDINAKNHMVKSFAERAAINAPLQGTQADIIKIAMNKIHKELIEKNLNAKMILQIHDELLFEVKEEDAKEVMQLVKNIMENIVNYSVPLDVNASIGNSWSDI